MFKKKLCLGLASIALLAGCSSQEAAPTASATTEAASTTAEATKETASLSYDKILIGLDDTFAPMGFRDDSGNIVGFDVDLANEVATRIGVEVEFVPIDWSMKETELDGGNIDAIWNGYSITDERKELVLFSDPYLDNSQIIIVLSDSEVTSKDDLAGKVVAVQKDSSALEAVMGDDAFVGSLDGGAPVEFDTNIDCFMDLESGRSDAIVVDEVLARYVMKQRGEDQYKVLDDNFGLEEYAVGFRKEDTDLCNAVNNALSDMKADGTYDKIYQTWFAE